MIEYSYVMRCRLASSICGYKCYQIELKRGYDYSTFHEDLKKMYTMAGVENQDTVFLFTDTQVNNQLFFHSQRIHIESYIDMPFQENPNSVFFD